MSYHDTAAAQVRLTALFQAMVAAARAPAMSGVLPALPQGRLLVLGAGKAAASMASQVEAFYGAANIARFEGMVVVPYGYGESTARIRVVEASHPTPDAESARAGAAMLEAAASLTASDRLLMLMSGGASSLLVVPRSGVTLADKRAAAKELLLNGLPIRLVNGVRQRLSAIKGGRLALQAAPAPVTTLIISDIPGDNPAAVGSGPTVPDAITTSAILRAIAAAGVRLSDPLKALLSDPASEPPRSDDPRLPPLDTHVVMTAGQALAAAEKLAKSWGWRVVNLGPAVEGEARLVARDQAALAANLAQQSSDPLLVLSGGETSVTVRGQGRGGRNSEYLLALSLALEGSPFQALAADTDGIDGMGSNAGAYLDDRLLAKARVLGLDPERAMDDNNALGIFAPLGSLIVTGPTRTNVNDFRAILLNAPD